MTSTKTKKRLSLTFIAVLILTFATSFISVSATDVDLTDNSNAVAYLTEQGGFNADAENADDYKTAANTYINEYSTNVGSDENVDENLQNAVTAVRDDISVYSTFWALLPPIIAIVLALITKEVYISLFVGILSGALLYSNFSLTGTIDHLFQGGFVPAIADSYNVGIILFLVVLGAIGVLMNKAGGSAAFGRWAAEHIKSKVGAQIATICLGILIFVDDYFNCLTVGSVMRPVTDKFNVSRSKLSYIIDATAAPVCIIAPISSWAAAVAGFVSEEQISGFSLFLRAIPYNFYAILTIVMMFVIVLLKFDFGPMKKQELNQMADRLAQGEAKDEEGNPKAVVWDLFAPVLVLIVACVLGLLYSGGFFTPDSGVYMNIIEGFSNADASVGLVIGSFISLIFTVAYYMIRRVLNFKECMAAVPEGFKTMVPAIMILCCAWTLKVMTDSLGAKLFIAEFVRNDATAIISFLPAIVFLIGCGLSFATGTSWGTFGILIPIVLAVFGGSIDNELCIIAISACMAGAVCGDHCSPISDTTIMASAGAQCDHIKHVSTQLPYALTTAGISFVMYAISGFVSNWVITLPLGIVVTIITMLIIKKLTAKNA